VNTIRTVQRAVERENDVLSVQPKSGVGDYVEIYCGLYEGHNFTVRDVRFNYDRGGFEYLRRNSFGGWYPENFLVLRRKAA
jgi:hypothetical protein